MEKLEEMSAFFNRVAPNYDVVHVENIDGGIETKHMLAKYLPAGTKTLLDLGIGTGLELGEIFKRFPDVRVTGYDIAKDMLDRLVEKYPGKHLDLRNESYLAAHFEENAYDAALTVMTLHHYKHSEKTGIYRRIFGSLRPGGIYVECDYMLSNQEYDDPQAVEDEFFTQYQGLVNEQHLDSAMEYHFDTPCTVENQIKMLCTAGFSDVKVVWQYKNTVVVTAKKEGDMSNKENFEGFKQTIIDENEQKYGSEIRAKFGNVAVDNANAKIKGMTQEQYDEGTRLHKEFEETLKAAFGSGDPAGELAQKACDLHRQWLSIFYPNYNSEYHMGLGEMYVSDERFKANYEKLAVGCAEFLRDAINIYCR